MPKKKKITSHFPLAQILLSSVWHPFWCSSDLWSLYCLSHCPEVSFHINASNLKLKKKSFPSVFLLELCWFCFRHILLVHPSKITDLQDRNWLSLYIITASLLFIPIISHQSKPHAYSVCCGQLEVWSRQHPWLHMEELPASSVDLVN